MIKQLPHPELAGILLAAGASSRLGEPKQLVRWRGQTLVEHSAALLCELCGAGVYVVTGAGHEQVAAALDNPGVEIVANPDWAEGMATSLRCGIDAAAGSRSKASLIMLCDQPLITSDDLHKLLDSWLCRPEVPVASLYSGISGVPAIIPAGILNGFRPVRPDQGAGMLLRESNNVQTVPVPNAAVDLDTQEDLQKLLKKE